ncbi:hypothetical protein C1N57_26935 (plasmid) [Priestia aryabhattai]
MLGACSFFYSPNIKNRLFILHFPFKLLLFLAFHFLNCTPFFLNCAPLFRAKNSTHLFCDFSFLRLS